MQNFGLQRHQSTERKPLQISRRYHPLNILDPLELDRETVYFFEKGFVENSGFAFGGYQYKFIVVLKLFAKGMVIFKLVIFVGKKSFEIVIKTEFRDLETAEYRKAGNKGNN